MALSVCQELLADESGINAADDPFFTLAEEEMNETPDFENIEELSIKK